MANITVKLNVVRFTVYIDDARITYTLVSENLEFLGMLKAMKKVSDSYKDCLGTQIDEVHYQNYVIPIKTGILEKDIEMYFDKKYGSDHLFYI